jgi:hypothetical protein
VAEVAHSRVDPLYGEQGAQQAKVLPAVHASSSNDTDTPEF